MQGKNAFFSDQFFNGNCSFYFVSFLLWSCQNRKTQSEFSLFIFLGNASIWKPAKYLENLSSVQCQSVSFAPFEIIFTRECKD